MIKISVVIPCYNQGAFVDEAVNSVLDQNFPAGEIIIVNDGSTDQATNEYLANYSMPGTRVITTANQGLAAARNTGIRAAVGEYILPLDADDKIGRGYLEKAVSRLEADPSLGIVYCKADFFGAKSGRWNLPDYSLANILAVNIIFCSGVFRKSDWQTVGGYKADMKYGYEDWDFWLSLLGLGRQVHCLDEVFFYYRIRDDSMGRTISLSEKFTMYLKVYKHHSSLFLANPAAFLKGWFLFATRPSYRP